MMYYSTQSQCPEVDLRQAVLQGLPPDNGLYMPKSITPLPDTFIRGMDALSLQDIAFEVINTLIDGYIPKSALESVIHDSFNFPVIVSEVDEIHVVELWHGPTMAFKDFGARFMSRLFSYFLREHNEKLTILTATSGDTGGAVASGFFQAPNIDVVILYPMGKVSDFQERQMTTWGDNIQAIAVEGNFDDCQALVKKAFLDVDLQKKRPLSSANSINLARLIPQTVYYFETLKKTVQKSDSIVVSVPSGNFGNLTAGVIAQKMGLPISHFIAATNQNRVVPDYLLSGIYSPKASVPTLSNAMDVGNPSNFYRLLSLHDNNLDKLQNNVSGYSYTDKQTIETIKCVYQESQYILDPHSAIGYQAALDYKAKNAKVNAYSLSTAHPYKFGSVYRDLEIIELPIPEVANGFFNKEKNMLRMGNDYNSFKNQLIRTI